jgi:hypothetical protein
LFEEYSIANYKNPNSKHNKNKNNIFFLCDLEFENKKDKEEPYHGITP